MKSLTSFVLYYCGAALLFSCPLSSSAGATATFLDGFTLTPPDTYPMAIPYGSALPISSPGSSFLPIQWAPIKLAGYAGSLKISDIGGTHGGVLGADTTTADNTKWRGEYITNINLATATPFSLGSSNDLLWSISLDISRGGSAGNTYEHLLIAANYDPATGKGLFVEFDFANGRIWFVQDGVAQGSSLGNPGVVTGNTSWNWTSLIFERYADGTIRIAKTAGGSASLFDVSIPLSDPNYNKGGTVALGLMGSTTTPGPIYIDNLAITIPEPSVFAFAALGLAMGFGRKYRTFRSA